MDNVLLSEQLAETLPEWVPYLVWYAVKDHWKEHGARQMFELKGEDGMQKVRHTQLSPPLESEVEFPCPDAVNAVIVVRIEEKQTIMMLAEEEKQYIVENPG